MERFMPIRSLLAEASFNSDETEIIAKSFDEAWGQVQSEQRDPTMSSLARTAIAKRIIEMARRDGVNADKLRNDAVAHVRNSPLWPPP
jgi:hypothetical protein